MEDKKTNAPENNNQVSKKYWIWSIILLFLFFPVGIIMLIVGIIKSI